MSNLMLGSRNWIREAGASVFSESATASGMGADQGALIHPVKKTRYTASPTSTIWDLGAARAVNLVLLGHTNATVTGTPATWVVDADADSAFSPVSYDGGSANVPSTLAGKLEEYTTYHAIHVPATPQTYRYWRYRITDATSVPTLDVGVFGLYNAFQPSVNMEADWRVWYEEPGEEQGSRGRAYYREIRPARMVVELSCLWLTEAEAWDDVHEMDRLVRSSEGVVAVLDPEDTTYLNRRMIYGFQDMEPIEAGPYVADRGAHAYRRTWRIKEMLAR